jgi:N-acetylmuramoyl-L-alanine amidase
LKRTRTDYIVVHCSDTYADMDIGAKEIRGWHTKERKWKDIGYHFVIRRDGTREIGRNIDLHVPDMDEVGAHVEGHNWHSVGICLVGGKGKNGKPEQNFTTEQYEALWEIIGILKMHYPRAQVVGHRDLNIGKACPSFDIKAAYAQHLHNGE